MSAVSTLHPIIAESRQSLASARSEMRRQHDAKQPSIQVCGNWTDQVDLIIRRLATTAAQTTNTAWPRRVCAWWLMVGMVDVISRPTRMWT